jgi:hypothetical protein
VELAGPQVHAGAASAAGVRPMPAQQVPALPTYLRGRWTPAAPARGVNFELRPDERGPTPKLFLNAAFAVSPRPAMRVDSGVLSDGGQPQPVAAVVPMTLLLVQANSLRPWRLELAVPVYGVPPPPDRPLEGCLALDAFAQTPGPGPGSYVGWLVLDGEVHGPQRVQLTR